MKMPGPKRKGKPPYRIPLMTEIAQYQKNGYKVVSTFSGCGGSCLGYRIASYKVVWANEFLPKAQESYRANCEADSLLDCRDIKLVEPEDILLATGLSKGELDIFDGSPPCQAFSTAGKREKGWGKAKRYENGTEQCNETMFDEYIRLLRGLMPKVFIAENVRGLTIGTAKKLMGDHQDDMFDSQDETILRKLMASGYVVEWRVLNAANFGVPQNRVRVVFQGLRKDLRMNPVWPTPTGYTYSIRDALSELFREIQYRRSGFDEKNRNVRVDLLDCSPTTQASNSCFVIKGYGKNLKPNKPGNSFPRNEIHSIEEPIDVISCGEGQIGSSPSVIQLREEVRTFTIAEALRLGGFPDDFVLIGSYAQQWERIGNSVAPPFMAAIAKTIQLEILDKL